MWLRSLKWTWLLLAVWWQASLALLGAAPDGLPLTAFFQEKVAQGRIAGAHVIVAKQGEVVYSRAFGYSEVETKTPLAEDAIYRIASMTKIVTAIAALQLWEQGHFTLDDPISQYLPEFKNSRVFTRPPGNGASGVETEPAVREPTIRDLFRHTAGIWGGKRYTDAGLRQWQGSLEDFVKRLAGIPLDTQPGTAFQYGYATDVLGRLIEKCSGLALDEYFRRRIFEPLGLKDTGFVAAGSQLGRLANHYEYSEGRLICRERPADSPFRKRAQALSGGGGWDYSYPGLLTTARDWLAIMEMLRLHGARQGCRLLRESTVKMMCSDQLSGIPGYSHPGLSYGLGVGVVRDGVAHGKGASTGTIFWAGAPHNTFFYVDFERGLSAALMIQNGPWRHDDIMDQFWTLSEQAFGAADARPQPANEPPPANVGH